jgi:hypothetical protein
MHNLEPPPTLHSEVNSEMKFQTIQKHIWAQIALKVAIDARDSQIT